MPGLFESKGGLIVSPGFEIQGFLEQSGSFTNIGHKERPIPLGPKGERYAEMVSCQPLYVTGLNLWL